MFVELSSPDHPHYTLSHVTPSHSCARGSFPFLRHPYEPFGLTPDLDFVVVHSQVLSWTCRRYLRLRARRAEAGDIEFPGTAVIYSVIEQIVRGTELVCELSDCTVLSD